ncbi:MAG: peptidoglycan-associated lipoprotein [Gammaproteobacteria bacterium RBG_16_51_14]|nr:MAG: peptidoglycan-associated lipoprotein [Gammaproteobacteria bacterium RBG_16_51_14]
MNSRALLILFIVTFLFGCGSSEVKEEAAVEDQGTAAGATDQGAQAYGADADAGAKASALDDPSSPLSVRVIYFDYDSSDIRSEFRPTIEAHAGYLAANSSVIVTLEGHADERGSREYNLALGERRAQSVKRQLVLLGASAGQIRLVSYGEERPAIEGHDEASWQQNRRVEILY